MTSERAKEFQQLEIWREFCAELDAIITTESLKFLSCSSEQLNQLQERVKAMKFVKELPIHIGDRDS